MNYFVAPQQNFAYKLSIHSFAIVSTRIVWGDCEAGKECTGAFFVFSCANNTEDKGESL